VTWPNIDILRYLIWKQTPQTMEKQRFMHHNTLTGAQAWSMPPEHGLGAPCTAYAPEHCWMRAKTAFCYFLVGKAWFLGLTFGVNSPDKYCIPHSQFLIQNEAVQEKGKHYVLLGRSFSSSLQVSLGYVLFLL